MRKRPGGLGGDVTDPHPATQDITFVSRTVSGRDDYGNNTYTETSRTVPGLYAPGGSSESTAGQDQVVSQEQVIVPDPPADLVVRSTDRVRVASLPSVTFEVDGRAESWAPGLVVPLRRVTG